LLSSVNSMPKDDWRHAACACDGCYYILRSNVTDWPAQELWQAYMQLTQAEAAFRMHKEALHLRPAWHQRGERVTAHILVCFLAYVLRKTLEGWCRQAGLGSSVTTVLEELARIQSTDVVVPTQDGRHVRLRCVVRPDRAQAILLGSPGPATAAPPAPTPRRAQRARRGTGQRPNVVPTPKADSMPDKDLRQQSVLKFGSWANFPSTLLSTLVLHPVPSS
jgi:hypothetical protein